MIKTLNLELEVLLEYQKKPFAKGYTPDWSEETFLLKMLKFWYRYSVGI